MLLCNLCKYAIIRGFRAIVITLGPQLVVCNARFFLSLCTYIYSTYYMYKYYSRLIGALNNSSSACLFFILPLCYIMICSQQYYFAIHRWRSNVLSHVVERSTFCRQQHYCSIQHYRCCYQKASHAYPSADIECITEIYNRVINEICILLHVLSLCITPGHRKRSDEIHLYSRAMHTGRHSDDRLCTVFEYNFVRHWQPDGKLYCLLCACSLSFVIA